MTTTHGRTFILHNKCGQMQSSSHSPVSLVVWWLDPRPRLSSRRYRRHAQKGYPAEGQRLLASGPAAAEKHHGIGYGIVSHVGAGATPIALCASVEHFLFIGAGLERHANPKPVKTEHSYHCRNGRTKIAICSIQFLRNAVFSVSRTLD